MSELTFRDVSVRFGTRRRGMTAVDRVNLSVPDGQVVGLVGESGSGKSTLARAAVGLTPLHGGQILLDGQSLRPRPGHHRLQMVFQDPYSSLDPRMSIGDTIAETIPRSSAQGSGRAARRREVARLLELVELDPARARAYPAQLSGGQRQRVALARALAGRPEVIIADEITSALDVSIQGTVLNLVRNLQRELGISMLFISHNLAVVRYVASHIAVMYLGRIVEYGPAAQVLTDPQHPYTRDLLAAVPDAGRIDDGDPADPAVSPAGYAFTGVGVGAPADAEPADPHHPPAGCRYHPRCPIGPLVRTNRDICRTTEPTAEHLHQAACHFAAELAEPQQVAEPARQPDPAADRTQKEHVVTRRMHTDDLTDLAVPQQPTLSPDGTQIVYVLRTLDRDTDKTVHRLWRVGTSDGAAQQLTRGTADTSPAWSPDGTRLAFLRAQENAAQVWVLPAGGGEAEQLTTLPLGAGAPHWNPDGTRIAFAAPVDIAAGDGEDDAARAKRAGAPIASDRLDYQVDGVGMLRTMRQHVHVLDLASGTCRQVSAGNWHAGEPAWSPDGTRLAFAAGMGEDTDLTIRAAAYVVDADDPKARPEPAGLADGFAGPITWTADGSALLVVGTPGAPVGHAGLLRLPLGAAGEPVNLAAGLDRNVMPGGPGYPGALPQLVDGGRTVLFCVRDQGCSHLYAADVAGGEPRLVLGGAGRNVSGLSVSGGKAVVALGTPTSYGEIVTVDLATCAETVRTEHGANLAAVELFERVEREFAISDGTVVQGWLIRDPDRSGPQPLLLDIHGGPHNAWNGAADEIHLYHQELAARGWTVLLLNPRGSDGYGEQFYDAALGAWGDADAKDFLEPIDALVAEGVADPKRLAVAGYSYGGFMTCYLTSRDDRFAAAVTGGVVSDLASMAGTSDAGHFLAEYELGGPPWANAEHYRQLSPLSKVDQVRTPTLIIQGAADLRCPIGQAEQWHTALRERGVPSRLVLYPGGSHLFVLVGPPSHRMDFNHRVVEWVEQYAGDAAGPRRPRIDNAHWQRRLAALAERHRVPGAQLGILRLNPDDGADELVQAAYGVLNKDTGVQTTADSVFQIGSISKVWTTTVAMQLVAEGLIDLDAPVVEVVPELRLGDADVTKQVTLRHLLTHTSGIDGDIFTDTGRGDDCLEKYVALLEGATQNHPLGATWSYCNAGFSLVGRIIEKLTGDTWDKALRERLFSPLGLEHTVTLPEEALLFRAAVGHVAEGGAEPARAPVWGLPRSLGPAGLITSTVADVLAFARMHLTGGLAADGTRVLGERSAVAMTDKHADLPDKHTLGDSWGLGWIRFDWDGHRVIGHDGNTIGQAAFLRLLPEQGLSVVLLTNGGNTHDLYEDLYREIFAEVAGVSMPLPLAPPAEPVTVDVQPYVGVYERASVRMQVLEGEEGPVLRTTVTGPLAELVPDPTEEYAMVAVAPDLFVVRPPGMETWTPVTFYSLPTSEGVADGGERYVHFGVRATPRVS